MARSGTGMITLAAGAALALGLLSSCSTQKIAPGIEPAPQTGFIARRTQVRLPQEKADMAVIFIGGFTEQVLAHSRGIYESMPLLPCQGRQLRAFYAWDGGTGCLLAHSTTLLQNDLRAFLSLNPKADVVMVGHSYGGSATMDALRHMGASTPRGRTIVLTVDPVSKRERSMPKRRAPGVDYWINVYCAPYRHAKDVFAAIGGPWRHCEEADVNLVLSGDDRDKDGKRYQHANPEALLFERPAGREHSAYELLEQACCYLNKEALPSAGAAQAQAPQKP